MSPIDTPSYSCCATTIVFFTENPSLRDASCCSVEVVYGGAALRALSRDSKPLTTYFASASAALCCSACVPLEISSFLPLCWMTSAVNDSPALFASSASRLQYSTGLNAWMSRSRSTMIRRATDWTRPAERPYRIFFQSSGDIV